uniref:Uncharacterized protein n=1 Tax=Anguilla anguilla TaxID=7936 RepID=A0A0E9QK02_ANGAN
MLSRCSVAVTKRSIVSASIVLKVTNDEVPQSDGFYPLRASSAG